MLSPGKGYHRQIMYNIYGFRYRGNVICCGDQFTDTARTYDPESDMTVVVGVPTYYSEESRVMIRFNHNYAHENHQIFVNYFCICWDSDCISKAGFKVLRIVSEPAAACLEYGET